MALGTRKVRPKASCPPACPQAWGEVHEAEISAQGPRSANASPSSQESLGSLSYSNSIRGRRRGHPGRVIMRHKVPQLKFTCREDGPAVVDVIPGADVLREDAGYNVSISFLELPVAQHVGSMGPHHASQRKEVVLQATLHSPDPRVRLFVDTCVASPDPHDFTTVKHDLIRQG